MKRKNNFPLTRKASSYNVSESFECDRKTLK